MRPPSTALLCSLVLVLLLTISAQGKAHSSLDLQTTNHQGRFYGFRPFRRCLRLGRRCHRYFGRRCCRGLICKRIFGRRRHRRRRCSRRRPVPPSSPSVTPSVTPSTTPSTTPSATASATPSVTPSREMCDASTLCREFWKSNTDITSITELMTCTSNCGTFRTAARTLTTGAPLCSYICPLTSQEVTLIGGFTVLLGGTGSEDISDQPGNEADRNCLASVMKPIYDGFTLPDCEALGTMSDDLRLNTAAVIQQAATCGITSTLSAFLTVIDLSRPTDPFGSAVNLCAEAAPT